MRPFFVAGTDTGVGKTHFALRWLKYMQSTGREGRAYKPVASGTEPFGDERLNPDVAALSSAQGIPPAEICFVTYSRPIAPLAAAEREGGPPDPDALAAWCLARALPDALFEGVGGLYVPIAPGWHVLDLICELGLPVVLVARAGLGTVNHTMLSARALLESGTEIAKIVISSEEAVPDEAMVTGFDLLCRELSPLPVERLAHAAPESPLGSDEAELFQDIERKLSF